MYMWALEQAFQRRTVPRWHEANTKVRVTAPRLACSLEQLSLLAGCYGSALRCARGMTLCSVRTCIPSDALLASTPKPGATVPHTVEV
jgi:hypothetical protein